MASPGTGPRVPAATCLECGSCGQGAYGFQHRLLLHDTHHVQRPWLWWPATQLPIRVSVLIHSVLPIQALCFLPSLCGGLFPSLSLAAPEAPGGFCCGLCLLYMCFSFVSVSQSQAPFVSTSQSLPPWVSWPFSLSPRTSARSVLHRSRTQ